MTDSLASSDTVTASVGTRWNFVPASVWMLNGLIMLGAYLTYQMWGTMTLVTIGIFAIIGAVVGMFACEGLDKGAVVASTGTIAGVGAGLGAIIAVGMNTSTNLLLPILVVIIGGVAILACWQVLRRKKWKSFRLIQAGIILYLATMSFVVPQGAIHSGRYMPEWTLVNPFNMDTPIVIAPPLNGAVPINKVPKDWTIDVKYHIGYPEKVTPLEWMKLRSPPGLLKDSPVLDKDGDPKKTVERWLNKFFPNVSTTAVVTWTPPSPKTRVWK